MNTQVLLDVLITWFPMLLLIGVWIYFMRRMQSSGGMTYGDFMEKYLEETQRHHEQVERILTRIEARLDSIDKNVER